MTFLLATCLFASQFSDVHQDHWAAPALGNLARERIVVGYPKQEESETYGKTWQQIVAMGRTKWYEFFTSRAGESTLGMSRAEYLFGTSLLQHNDSKIKKTSSALRSQIVALRKPLQRFAESLIDVSSAFTGGGTMWTPVRAAVLANTEEVVSYLLGAKNPKAKPTKTSEITNQLNHVESQLKLSKESIDSMAMHSTNSTQAQALVSSARKEFDAIVRVAKGLSRTDSDRVLSFCLLYAKMPEMEDTSQILNESW